MARAENASPRRLSGSIGVLTEKDWLSRLEDSYLTADQKQQVRETAYVTLVYPGRRLVRFGRVRGRTRNRSREAWTCWTCPGLPSADAGLLFRAWPNVGDAKGTPPRPTEDEKQFKAAAARTAWDYYLPGHMAGWRGDLDEAIRSYQAALALQPNHYNSLFFMGVHLSLSDRQAEAVGCFTACIALRPGECFAYWYRSASHSELGHLDAAIADLEKAADPWPRPDAQRLVTLDWLCRLLFENGQHQQAQELLRRMIANQASPPRGPQVSDVVL